MTLILDSVWAKIGRAEEHAKSVEDEITAWVDSRPYSIIRQRNTDATRYSSVVRFGRKPDLDRWALVMGDCIHNLRAALDHTVYYIAIHESGQDPPPDERSLQFPIGDTCDLYRKQRWRIRSLSERVRAEIERLQPYNRLHEELPPLLGIVGAFDDADKHRLLQVSVMQPIKVEFRNISGLIPGQRVESIFHVGAVVDGTEIAALVLDRSTPDVHYDYSADLAIAVRHTPGPKGHTMTGLRALLRLLKDEVRTAIEHIIAVVPNGNHTLPPSRG